MARKSNRDDELSTKPAIRKHILEVYQDVETGFVDSQTRADDIKDYWDAYNCKLSANQFYNGDSKIFVPIIREAVQARKTRFGNALFPQSGRYVEVTTGDADVPFATMALLEHYVRKCRMQTAITPALLVAGDVEGQYSLYVDWIWEERSTAQRVKKGVKIGELEFDQVDTIESVEEKTVKIGRPSVEVLLDSDLMILPVASEGVDDAVCQGGSVTIIRRWSKAKIRKMIASGDIVQTEGETLLKSMSRREDLSPRETRKKLMDAIGFRGDDKKTAIVLEVWCEAKVDGDWRLCRSYLAGGDMLLSTKRCPYWCDRVPVISIPVDQEAGVAKGYSQVKPCIDLQVLANDAVNQGADTANYSAMPIIMTDPEKNPRVGSMILGLASIWEVDPNSTKFAEFPQLWKDAFDRIASCKSEIFQMLSVNPSMLPQQTGIGSKMNQAEIANEQAVDLLTTADAVTTVEQGVFSPLMQRFADYDHQFREDEITIKVYGEMGMRARMESVPTIQVGDRYEFKWYGSEAARNAAQVQNQIAMANVFKGIPPDQYEGYKLNMAPLMVQLAENAFGPRLAPLILIDLKSQLSVPPDVENEMLEGNFDVAVHPLDDDQQHIQAHMQAMQMTGDPDGVFKIHIQKHMIQMQSKVMAQAQRMGLAPAPPGAGGLPGTPGGAGPGVAGAPATQSPQEGAQPGQPRMKGPPGMIHQDQMAAAGAPVMPRKF